MENKTIKIIALIAMLIIAIGGPILSYKQQEKIRTEEQERYEDYIEDNHEDEEYEEEDKEPEEVITYLDPLVKNLKLTITDQDKINLIKSTDCELCVSDVLLAEMYNNEISDNYKLIYTASILTRYIDETHTDGLYVGEMSIKQDTLLSFAKQIWGDVEVPELFNINLFYYGIHSLSCEYGTCTFGRDTFGVTGVTQFNGYETKTTIEGNKIKANTVFIVSEFVEHREEDDKYIFDIKIYDKKDGKLIKEIKSYEEKDDYVDAFEEFEINTKNLTTYTYTFDEENRLVSVERE